MIVVSAELLSAVAVVLVGALIVRARARRVLPASTDLDEAAARECWPSCLSPGTEPGQLSFATMFNSQGLRIATYAIRARSPVGAVIVVHGFRVSSRFEFIGPSGTGGAHTKWKGCVLSELLERGLSLYLIDLQGHGQSDSARGARAYFERFDDLPRDVLQYARQTVVPELRLTEGGRALPLFLYGQSLGGAVVARASQMCDGILDGVPLAGLILSAPAIAPPAPPPMLLRILVRIMAQLVPTRSAPLSSPPNGIDHHAYQAELATEPTHFHGNPRWGFLSQFLATSDSFLSTNYSPPATRSKQQSRPPPSRPLPPFLTDAEAPAGSVGTLRARSLLVICSYADQLVSWRAAAAAYERAVLPTRKTLVLLRGKERDGLDPHRQGEARSSVDGVAVALDERTWSEEVLRLPLWHNLTREPHGEVLATAIAQWVRTEVELGQT